MGRVYLATSPRGRVVAVKAIRPEMTGDRKFHIRFRREVEAASVVSSKYTAPVVDAEPDGTTPWLATAYIPGPTLAEAVAEHGPLPVDSALALGAGVAEALMAVHAAGLVHRDLKPSNVLLAADGPRVIDFGIVRASDGYDLTHSGMLFGSFEYMCPEHATGDPIGPEGDVFSLGSVLAFAATGRAPFNGSSVAALLYQVAHGAPDLTDVPEPLDKIISLCLARDPDLRITAERLAAACAPSGAEQVLGDGWLPAPVTASIARRAAAVRDLDDASWTGGHVVPTPVGPVPAAPASSVPVPDAQASHAQAYAAQLPAHPAPIAQVSAAPDGSLPGVADGAGVAGAAGAPVAAGTAGAAHAMGQDLATSATTTPMTTATAEAARPAPDTGTHGPGDVVGAEAEAGAGSRTLTEPAEPTHPTSPGHRNPSPTPRQHRAPSWPGVSRRAILAASLGTAVVVGGGGAVLIMRRKDGGQAGQPLGPAPKPDWTFRSDPLLQAPAVFVDGTVLVKTRPGNLVCLDLKDGTRPKWLYRGISQSPTPALLANGAAVALGSGSTVIGVDPADGTERFTLDFGPDFRFDTLLGGYADRAVSIVGLRLQRESDEEGVATSTETVFGVDLQARRTAIIPISAEDVGITLQPVIVSGAFVYADGLRNVTVRNTDDSSVRWKYPVGYDLRPGLAVLGGTVFAIGRELIALDLATGRLRWRVKAEHGQFASLGAAGDTVYVTGTDPYGVCAFDAQTGSRRWFCPTPRLNVDNPVATGPHAIYVPAFENRDGFYAIDTARGRILWNFTDGRETGVNNWQLACDGAGHLVAQHFDRTYSLPTS
ncbi:PQQ-binding-like beta-propeller repeat protein [Streptomyces sp. NPDC087903]|uniref:serine/threonine-protein kinase n=1 Tax=Streptomyces sp. NPDC087903 TaxID=3365819 RepID=UPI0038281954